jgi:poly(A) polymerase
MIVAARKLKKKVKEKIFAEKLPIIKQELNPKLIDRDAKKIIKTLTDKGFEAYLVGGCIRDILLGLKPKDFDITTNATPKQINKIFKRSRIIGRRFQIVHVLFGRRDFIEVSTFRGAEENTKMLRRDNNFGDIFTDAKRRDLTINALYYSIAKKQIIDITSSIDDINNKKIQLIGDNNLRFNQDPVRILRAIRFSVKLDFKIDEKLKQAIFDNKNLLKNIPAARFYEETQKLFHNSKSYETFKSLIKFDCLKYLFPKTTDNDLIKIALDNTAARIKQNQGVSPAFIFAVFLYDEYLNNFASKQKTIKNKTLASKEAASLTIVRQTKFVSIPKFVSSKVINTWLLQYQLEQKNPKNTAKILQNKDFRMAYDFLEMRAKSINPELKETAEFWKDIQANKEYKNDSTRNKKPRKNL